MDLFLLAPIHSVGFLHGPGVKSYKKWALTPYCRDEFKGRLIESLGLPLGVGVKSRPVSQAVPKSLSLPFVGMTCPTEPYLSHGWRIRRLHTRVDCMFV